MAVQRSDWSIEEGVAASSKTEHKHQDINTIQHVSSARDLSFISPVLCGIIIGALLAGIALGTILPMYIQDQSKRMTTSTTTSTSSTTSTSTTSTTSSTSSTSTTSTTSSTSSTSTTSTTSSTSSTSTTSTTSSTSSTSTTSTTSTSTTTTTTDTSTTTTSTATSTTTTAPPSTMCAGTTGFYLSNDQFVYSPTSQQYAGGMLNNQFGVYEAYGYDNVTSTALWTATQLPTSETVYFAGQTDRNLVVYGVHNFSVYWTAAISNNGTGAPFCLEMLDTGDLIWTDNARTIIWQSNSTVQSG